MFFHIFNYCFCNKITIISKHQNDNIVYLSKQSKINKMFKQIKNDKKNWGKLKTRKVAKREMIAEVVSPRNHIQLY